MKKIGFLSFGHWTPSPHSQTRSAADALLQSIDLAVAAEEDDTCFILSLPAATPPPRPGDGRDATAALRHLGTMDR